MVVLAYMQALGALKHSCHPPPPVPRAGGQFMGEGMERRRSGHSLFGHCTDFGSVAHQAPDE